MQNTDFFVDVLGFARREPAGVRIQVAAGPDGWPGLGVALLIPSYSPAGLVEEWKRLDWWRDTSTGRPRVWPSIQEATAAADDLRADVLEAPAFAVIPAQVLVVLAEGLDPAGLVLDAGRPVAVVV